MRCGVTDARAMYRLAAPAWVGVISSCCSSKSMRTYHLRCWALMCGRCRACTGPGSGEGGGVVVLSSDWSGCSAHQRGLGRASEGRLPREVSSACGDMAKTISVSVSVFMRLLSVF